MMFLAVSFLSAEDAQKRRDLDPRVPQCQEKTALPKQLDHSWAESGVETEALAQRARACAAPLGCQGLSAVPFMRGTS